MGSAMLPVYGGTHDHNSIDELCLLDLGIQRVPPTKLGAAEPVTALQRRPPLPVDLSCIILRECLRYHFALLCNYEPPPAQA